jgi:hypothetical protein
MGMSNRPVITQQDILDVRDVDYAKQIIFASPKDSGGYIYTPAT